MTTYTHFAKTAFRADKVLQKLTDQLTSPTHIAIIGDSVIDSWTKKRDLKSDGIGIKIGKLLEKPILNMA